MASESAALFAQLLSGPDEEPEVELCLVTREPLEPNHVTLACGHKFNYLAIYNELKLLRRRSARPYDTSYVNMREIRCPYCKEVTTGILPYVPTLVPELTRGLNSPQSQSIGKCTCEHVLTRGQRKGQMCGKAGFMYKGKGICLAHWRSLTSGLPPAEWTAAHQALMRNHTCSELRGGLKAQGYPTSGNKKVLVARVIEKKVDLGNPLSL